MAVKVLTTEALFLALFLVLMVWYIRFHFKRRLLYKLAEQFNGPRPFPIVGNVFKAAPFTEIADQVMKSCSYYKSPARLWFGPRLTIHIWDPENAKIVLNSQHALAKEPYLYSLFENLTGRGIITLPVNKWKQCRRLIAPTFNNKILKSYFNVLSSHSIKLVKNIHHEVDKGIFDSYEYVFTYAIGSVMDALLDFTDTNSTPVNTRVMIGWLKRMWVATTSRMVTLWYYWDCIFNRSEIGKDLSRTKASYNKYMASLIKDWEETSIKKLGINSRRKNEKEPFRPRKYTDHLQSILDGHGKFTIDELRGEVENIIASGLETTSSTLGYLLMILGMYPDIQEKVFQEILLARGNKEKLEYEDLMSLNYLEMVIKEVLRFFPGMVGVARYSNNEIQLTNHTIPAHTSIILGIIALHKDPNIWPNPNKFDPDRFLPEEEAKRHPYSWIPFSAGPRNCIAVKYAYMTIKTALSTFLLNYKVASNHKSIEDVDLAMMIVFKPTHGYNISITRRQIDN